MRSVHVNEELPELIEDGPASLPLSYTPLPFISNTLQQVLVANFFPSGFSTTMHSYPGMWPIIVFELPLMQVHMKWYMYVIHEVVAAQSFNSLKFLVHITSLSIKSFHRNQTIAVLFLEVNFVWF